MSLRYFFLEDIRDDPVDTRRKILAYFGADADKKADVDPAYNRKANWPKLEMATPIRNVLAQHFAEEAKACAALFGGRACEWPVKYLPS
jgi:hypothetical protein